MRKRGQQLHVTVDQQVAALIDVVNQLATGQKPEFRQTRTNPAPARPSVECDT
jgi:hypothetical protein